MKSFFLCLSGALLLFFRVPAQEHGRLRHDFRIPDTTDINAQILKGRQYMLTRPDTALSLLAGAARDSRQIRYHDGIVQALAFSGGTLIERGRYQEGLRVLNEAVLYVQMSGYGEAHLSSIYSWMAEIHDRTGNYEKSLELLHKSLASARIPASTMPLALVYNNLGLFFHHTMLSGRNISGEQALPYLDSAEQISRASGNNQILTLVLYNKGVVYKGRGDLQASERYLLAALEQADEHRYIRERHGALMSLGELYIQLKQPEKALTYLFQLHLDSGHVAVNQKLSALHAIGVAYFALGNYKDAEKVLRKARDGYVKTGLKGSMLRLHDMFVLLYRTTGRYREALEHQDAYIALKDSIAGAEIMEQVQRMDIQYQAAEKDKEIMSQQLQIARQTRNLEQKNFWIILTCSVALLTAVLLAVLYRNYRHRQALQHNQIRLLQQEQHMLQQESRLERMKALIEGEENERARIARALHDGIAAQLAVIKMYINRARKNMRDLEHSEDFLFAIRQLDKTAAELRETAHNLMPEVLLHHGLFEAVDIFCENMSQGDTLRVSSQHYGILPPLEPEFELSIYRIVQELVQNINKHAEATSALVQLNCYDNKNLAITVEDNGKGIDPQHTAGGTGLKHIAERIRELKGRLDIKNGNPGTNIYIEIDLHHLHAPDETAVPADEKITQV